WNYFFIQNSLLQEGHLILSLVGVLCSNVTGK
ncbi:unnamed protein product, partial [marine sediment metagenome]